VLRSFAQADADRDALLSLAEARAALGKLGIPCEGKSDEQLLQEARAAAAAAETAAPLSAAAPATDGASAAAAPSATAAAGSDESGAERMIDVGGFVRIVHHIDEGSERVLGGVLQPLVVAPMAHAATLGKPVNKLTA
jgi:hypothetical protein